MLFGKLLKLGALAFLAAGRAEASGLGDRDTTTDLDDGTIKGTTYFVTKTVGGTTYTFLSPRFTGEPATDGLEGVEPTVVTDTATATTTATETETETELLTEVVTVTVVHTVAAGPMSPRAVDAGAPLELLDRDVTTVTVYGGYGSPPTSTGHAGAVTWTPTAITGDTATTSSSSSTAVNPPVTGPSTITTVATTTTTVTTHRTPTFSLTYASGVPGTSPSSSSLVTTYGSAGSGSSSSWGASSLSASSLNSTITGPSSSSGPASTISTTVSGLTVPAESLTPTPPTASATHSRSGGGRAVPEAAMATVLRAALLSATLAYVFGY